MPTHITSERVVWQGKEFRVRGLTWGQEFSAGLPDVVAATSGYSVWEGSCEIIPDYETFLGGANPWSDAYPKPGEYITISVSVDGRQVGVYRPVVDDISFTANGASISFIMNTRGFSRKIRLPPIMQTAPATLDPWGSENYGLRYPAPTVLWTVSEAFRAAGYHLTPPIHRSTVIDVSMQGAVWANQWRRLGEIIDVQSQPGSTVAFPRLYGGDGILWMHQGRVVVANSPGAPSLSAGFRASFLVHKSSRARIEVLIISSPDWLSVVVDGNRRLQVFQKKDEKLLATIEAKDWAGSTDVTLVYKSGRITLYAGETKVTVPTDFSGTVTGARITAEENAGVAGFQIDTLSSGEAPRIKGFTPTARIKGGLFTSYMRVCLPSVRDEPAKKVLDEIAAATLSSWWVDGEGIANFEDANSLTAASPSHTINADEIGSYQITSDLLNAGSSVAVTYSESTRSASNRYAINLWSKGGTATAGTTTEEFVKPDEDREEWIDPDFTFENIGSNVAGFNTREGSWRGCSKDGATHDAPTIFAPGYSFSSRAITPWTLLISESFTEAASRTVAERSDVARALRGADTPIFRGRGLVTREDVTITLDGGMANAPSLDIDARKWVDRSDRAEEIAAYLMRFLASPPPLLKSLTIPYRPAIKIGQAVRIRGYSADGKDFLFGANITCVATGVWHSADECSTSLSLRVIRVESTVKTWRELEAASRRAGITWAQAEKNITDRGVTWSLFGASDQDYGG